MEYIPVYMRSIYPSLRLLGPRLGNYCAITIYGVTSLHIQLTFHIRIRYMEHADTALVSSSATTLGAARGSVHCVRGSAACALARGSAACALARVGVVEELLPQGSIS